MKERKRRAPRIEDLIPDAEKRQVILQRLYQGDPLVGDGGIFTDLLQALVNAALEGEMDGTLAESSEDGERNRRNGHNTKYVKSRVGPLEVRTPRDRQGLHEPKLIGKWDRELSSGMDEIILRYVCPWTKYRRHTASITKFIWSRDELRNHQCHHRSCLQ